MEMNQYLLLIQDNAKTKPSEAEWSDFFSVARASDTFVGGSEVGDRELFGDEASAKLSDHVVGYMRFDTDDKSKVTELLKIHPVVLNGGSVELCELPKS